jgi:hypothetical protein
MKLSKCLEKKILLRISYPKHKIKPKFKTKYLSTILCYLNYYLLKILSHHKWASEQTLSARQNVNHYTCTTLKDRKLPFI